MPSNWGTAFTVGGVPVFKYLESRDVDEVGYTLRTASLMTPPEYFFNEANPSDYVLFGVRYLILPPWRRPAVPARRIATAGGYELWETGHRGYVHVGRIDGVVALDRTNVGVRSIPVLNSSLGASGLFPGVRYGGGPGAGPLPGPAPAPAIGAVTNEHTDLAVGRARATVRLRRAGVVVLSASFDPGWHASVDGRREPTLIVAPALVAVAVPPGAHRVAFSYSGFGAYLPLWLLAVVSLLGLYAIDRRSPTTLPGDSDSD